MFSPKVLLLTLVCLWISGAFAVDTLSLGDKLNSSDSLVSQNGAVTLGFIKQEYGVQSWDGKVAGYYLAMSYTEDSLDHPIWLANRADPIADDSGVLILDNTGLKITHTGANLIQLFSPQSTFPTTNINLVLQDSGNLVLQHEKSNGQNITILWQSFDHPTDTFLPGMKLGFDRERNWSLTSWLTDSIPAPGAFTLEWDPKRGGLSLRLRDRVLWAAGESFENIMPLDPMNMNYNFTNVSSVDQQYVYYTLVIDNYTPEQRRKNSRVMLRHDGVLIYGDGMFMFDQSFCVGDSTEKGCERREEPTCRSKGDKYELRSIRVTSSLNYSLVNSNLTISDCKDICWDDCRCLGVQEMDLGCGFILGSYEVGDSMRVQVIIGHHSKSKSWIWILISIGMALTITISIGLIFLCWRRRQLRLEEEFLQELMTSDKTSDEINEFQIGNKGHNLNIYTSALINSATNCFSPENLLGKGGFGPVFKGTLPDGQVVAIKRLSTGSGQGLVEFKNELILIAKLQHTNLVRLLGFCVQGEEKIPAHEYMPNKSLDYFIFDESKRKVLDWNMRFTIIEGTAQGILYLHKYSRLRIIHRDLKLSNILLDENMNPKISDFGMARIYKTNEPESNTNRIVGTYGYMSPEYAMGGYVLYKI